MAEPSKELALKKEEEEEVEESGYCQLSFISKIF